MVRDVEVENPPPLVGQDEEAEQHLESGGRHPRFDRQAAKLHKRQGEGFLTAFRTVLEMLETDPSNAKGRYAKRIKKLTGIPQGQGQYRARHDEAN